MVVSNLVDLCKKTIRPINTNYQANRYFGATQYPRANFPAFKSCAEYLVLATPSGLYFIEFNSKIKLGRSADLTPEKSFKLGIHDLNNFSCSEDFSAPK